MSNIKKKDRKESDLQVALDGEDLVTSIMSMVNDEAKISKRQRLLIGKRIFDNSFESIENLRAANMIRSSSKKNFNKRISLGLDAQIYAKNKRIFKYQLFKKVNYKNRLKTKEKKMPSCLGLYIENGVIKITDFGIAMALSKYPYRKAECA